MNTTPVDGSGEGLGELIKQVERLEKRLRHLPGRGEEGFPLGGRAVLASLWEHGAQTVPQIGRRRGTSRQNIQVLVNGLKAEGWVEMAENPAHRRSEFVRLTGKGLEAVERMAAKEAVFLEGLSGQVSAKAVKGALGVLRQLGDLIGGEGERKQRTVSRPEKEQPEPVIVEHKPSDLGELQPEEEEMPLSLL
jgi:DNA-binding MarR family transcriptional regulator